MSRCATVLSTRTTPFCVAPPLVKRVTKHPPSLGRFALKLRAPKSARHAGDSDLKGKRRMVPDQTLMQDKCFSFQQVVIGKGIHCSDFCSDL